MTDVPGVFKVSLRRIDTAQGGEKPKEQQLTSNQSITIDDCMMVTLHRSKKSNACQKSQEGYGDT